MVRPDGRRAARSNPNPSRTPNPNPDPSPDPNPNQVDAPFVDECTYIDRTSPPSGKENPNPNRNPNPNPHPNPNQAKQKVKKQPKKQVASAPPLEVMASASSCVQPVSSTRSSAVPPPPGQPLQWSG